MKKRLSLITLVFNLVIASHSLAQPVAHQRAHGRPDALINLASDDGVKLVQGQWKYHDAKIVTVDHRNPGPDFKATGEPNSSTPRSRASSKNKAKQRPS